MSLRTKDNQETLLALAPLLLIFSPMLDPVITCCLAAGLLIVVLAGGLIRNRSGVSGGDSPTRE